jgi:Tol biopolymer transport system component/DNA-binding winged helix-turn-helix (wHTH) protein
MYAGVGQSDRRIYEFASFRIDPNKQLLVRDGRPIPLTPKTFEILLVLVRHCKEVVSKDDLMKTIWPDTFVEEANLSRHIFMLRKALGETLQEHRYIVTVPGRGYRFAEGVQLVPDGEVSIVAARHSKVEVQTEERNSWRWWVIFPAGGVIAIALIASILWFRNYKDNRPATDSGSALEPAVLPLLSLPGEERMPAYSPDASRIAFAWRAPDRKKSGIYAVVVGSQSLLRLTQSGDDYSPIWSPDGRYVAFLRDSGDKFSIELVPALGGAERRIYTGPRGPLSHFAHNEGMSFSSDGKLLAFAEWNSATQQDSIKLLSLEDSSTRVLTSPPPGFHDRCPAFSPRGDKVAFVRSSGPLYVDELFVVSAATGQTRQLTFDHKRIFGPPTWTRGGSEVIYSSNRAGLPSLWQIVLGGTPHSVAGAGPVAWYPSVSPTGGELAYEHPDQQRGLWRLELRDATHPRGRASALISSTNVDSLLPQFSPDGRKIAFQSDRSGYQEIWICDADGSNPIQVTSLQSFAGSPHWSPDGLYLAFDYRPGRHSEIHVVEVPGGPPHPIAVFPDADNVVPSWSRDGQWIYFASNRGGNFDIWKVAVRDGTAIQNAPVRITKTGGFAAMESADGRSLLFSKQFDPGIRTVSRDGGAERSLWAGPGPDDWANWALARNGMYFLAAKAATPPEIEFLDFKKRQISHVAKLERDSFYGLALSPDGKSLIYSQHDRDEHDILIVKNFR